jgi:hypothetical protein
MLLLFGDVFVIAVNQAKPWRNQALILSANHTSSMKTISMLHTSEPLNIFMEESICCPNPPAPTKPNTADDLMAHSHR